MACKISISFQGDRRVQRIRGKRAPLASLFFWVLVTGAGYGAARGQDVGSVNVSVDPGKPENILAPRAFGIHSSVYDNAMQEKSIADLLRKDGVYTLRYPGGGYADTYHWSVNKLNGWKASGNPGYLAKGTDFGSFVGLLERLHGTAVITVNYGTNLQGTGPGEPAEAAAWVAYANGKPDDATAIGKDSTGTDWKTAGYWASLRAALPLATDDGYNFLRIGVAQGLNIKYWEIGNEVFGNGYYMRDNGGYENDLHVAYSANPKDDGKVRQHNAKLSPTSYGEGVVAFSKAMKAVDPRISIGAVLNTPPMDFSWGPNWNKEVLRACSPAIDFVIVHWYTGGLLPPDWKELDNANFLSAPTVELPQIIQSLLTEFHDDAGGKSLQFAVTELGPRPFAKITDWTAIGLFAADAYASLAEDGAVNIDWLELHSESFLSNKDSTPGAAFFGIQMAHNLLNIRDSFVASHSNNELLSAHASQRADGSIGLLLINRDPKNAATVRVKIEGAPLSASGTRFDWGKGAAPTGTVVRSSKQDQLGNNFTLTVPAYTATTLVIPGKAK
jgi:hypothetical protein